VGKRRRRGRKGEIEEEGEAVGTKPRRHRLVSLVKITYKKSRRKKMRRRRRT